MGLVDIVSDEIIFVDKQVIIPVAAVAVLWKVFTYVN